MINKKTTVSAGIGALVAVVLGFFALVRLGDKMNQEARQKQAAVVLAVLDKEQARLGVHCVAADAVLLRYIRAVGPVLATMSSGKPIPLSNPIIEQGERTADVIQTCRLQRMYLRTIDNKMLEGLAIGNDAVMDDFYSIRLDLTRVTASWCTSDCVLDTRLKVKSAVQRLERLLQNS